MELARRELTSVLRVLEVSDPELEELPWGTRVWAFSPVEARALAGRLAFSHRLLRPLATGTAEVLRRAAKEAGGAGHRGAFRASSGSPRAAALLAPLGRAYVEGGGRVDLDTPESTLVVIPSRENPIEFALAEELAQSGRQPLFQRPPKTLPFRKPITLSPLLARALVNLSEVRPGGRLLDPFCGTGAILLEGGVLGCRLLAADVDGHMVRGTLSNLALHALTPEMAVQADIGRLPESLQGHLPLDGIATDPPYGRASTTKGETASPLLRRALETIEPLLRKGGRMALMVPTPVFMTNLPGRWRVDGDPIPMRVHRSLTRWIFVLRN